MTEIVGIIVGIVGALSAAVAFLLMPANRRKILAETKYQLAKEKETLVATQGDQQRQINELGLENERLRDQREKDYVSREKERDAKKREYDILQDRLSNFETRHIQVLSELQTQRKNSQINMVKIGTLELQTAADALQREKDKVEIQKLKDEVLRLSKVTGQLELRAENNNEKKKEPVN